MNHHLTDGQLRAALDGEVDSEMLQHLESCAQCRSRRNLLEAQIRPTGTHEVHPKLRWRVGTRFSGEVVRFSSPGFGPFPGTFRARIDWGVGRRSTGTMRLLMARSPCRLRLTGSSYER